METEGTGVVNGATLVVELEGTGVVDETTLVPTAHINKTYEYSIFCSLAL